MAGDFQPRSLGTIRLQVLKTIKFFSCPLHTKINMVLKQQEHPDTYSDILLDYLILPKIAFAHEDSWKETVFKGWQTPWNSGM